MKTYHKTRFTLSKPDETALTILRLDLAENGYPASRSAAVRYALHSTVRALIAATANLKRPSPPADIAPASPTDLPLESRTL